MIRASQGDKTYWEKWADFRRRALVEDLARIATPGRNPAYRPQFVLDTTFEQVRLILTEYSLGTGILELRRYFSELLDTWELSNKLAANLRAELNPGQGWDHRHLSPRVSDDIRAHNDPRAWVFAWSDLNHYNWCFWLIGLGLALEVPDDQWQRLLVLTGNEGEDILLDRVIASRQPERKIGTRLLHPRPYARLVNAIDASPGRQPALLRDFTSHWYAELARKGRDELWWYIYGDPVKHPLEKGSYFGRWCIEAVAAVKAFGLDDSLCLGHEHYPGDLLRPNGPSTHLQRRDHHKNLFARLFGRKSP